MDTEQQAQERQAYKVPGSQMRWRAAQLRAQGYPFDVERVSHSNTYIFFVQQPPTADPFAYQPPPQSRFRQAWPAWDSANVLRWLLVVTVVTMLLGVLYMVFVRAAGDEQKPQPQAQQEEDDGGMWAWLSDLRLPWQEEPAQPAQVQPQATDDGGWKWPWDRAMDAAADTAESVQTTVTAVSAAILAVLALLIVLALVNKGRK